MKTICSIVLLLTLIACENDATRSGHATQGSSAEEELFDQRISFQQVLQRLRDDDPGRISRTIVQLIPVSERKEYEKLLVAVWERDRGAYPSLNWDSLGSQRVRISVARVLGKWQPTDLRYYEYVSAMSDRAETGYDRVEALMALGSFAREADIERLRTIAIGNDELLATGALSGLVMSNKQAAISEVERISTDAALSEQRRKFARQLLGMPRPSSLR